MACDFCGHPTPHGCWDAKEAAWCGNMTADALKMMQQQSSAAEAVLAIREAASRAPTPQETEARERAELARLKAKYDVAKHG